MKLQLYKIEQEYIALAESIIDNGGEVSEEQEIALQINKEQLESKGVCYGFVIRQLDSEVDIIDAEIKRLESLKKSRTKTVERLKTTLSDAMQLFDITELKTPTLKINFRKSESVEVENIALLDKDYVKVVTTESADKTAIKEAIKNGIQVTGAVLKQNLNLQIK